MTPTSHVAGWQVNFTSLAAGQAALSVAGTGVVSLVGVGVGGYWVVGSQSVIAVTSGGALTAVDCTFQGNTIGACAGPSVISWVIRPPSCSLTPVPPLLSGASVASESSAQAGLLSVVVQIITSSVSLQACTFQNNTVQVGRKVAAPC
jgi:hypothetical protein